MSAAELKTQGNSFYKRKQYNQALECYSQAIEHSNVFDLILCIRKHIFSSMERKREGPKCPFVNCEQELLHYDDLKNILSDSEYLDINYKLNMNEISKLKGIKYCLTPDCDYAMQYDTSHCNKNVTITRFDCVKCSNTWCLQCQLPWHVGFSTCNEFKRSIKRKKYENVADKTYNKWYKSHRKSVKQCPACGAHVERNEGCNHMTCRCRTHWCWSCHRVIIGPVHQHYGLLHWQG
eukprot:213432_1